MFGREHGHYFLDDSSDSPGPRRSKQQSLVKYWMRCPRPNAIFVPMGDTALIRGVAAEAKRHHPTVRVEVVVQAERAPAYARSWQEGRVVVTEERAIRLPMGWRTRHPLEANVHSDPPIGG